MYYVYSVFIYYSCIKTLYTRALTVHEPNACLTVHFSHCHTVCTSRRWLQGMLSWPSCSTRSHWWTDSVCSHHAFWCVCALGALLHAVCLAHAVLRRCCGHTVTFITTYYRNALCAYNMIWVSLSTGYSVLNISPCPHFKSDKAGSYIGLEVCTHIQCIAITANHVHSCPRFHDTLYSYSMYS